MNDDSKGILTFHYDINVSYGFNEDNVWIITSIKPGDGYDKNLENKLRIKFERNDIFDTLEKFNKEPAITKNLILSHINKRMREHISLYVPIFITLEMIITLIEYMRKYVEQYPYKNNE